MQYMIRISLEMCRKGEGLPNQHYSPLHTARAAPVIESKQTNKIKQIERKAQFYSLFLFFLFTSR